MAGIKKEIGKRSDHGVERGDIDLWTPLETKTPKVVMFAPNDQENPFNWSLKMKTWITILGIFQVSNSTFASSMPSGATSEIADEFGLQMGSPVFTLPISMFIAGYIFGPLFLSPLSEFYGRKYLSIYPVIWYNIWTLACAVAPNMPALLVFRFLSGLGASAPLSVTGGMYADIWKDPVVRGRCIAIFCAATMVGPVVSPIISGFVSVSYLTWKFCFWILLIVGVATLIPQIFWLPETFGPILLIDKAKRLRAETGDDSFVAPAELEDRSVGKMLKLTLTRPLEMLFTEAIVAAISLYLAFVYGTFYMTFQSYPIIFQGVYGFSPGIAGLAFLPICIGSSIACLAVILWDEYLLRRSRTSNSGPFSGEYRRLPLAAMGGLTYIIGLFWLGWTGSINILWIIPMLSGIMFGLGLSLVFMTCLNYITDAYTVYAASALAASSMSRSVFGAALPVAARRMYASLGVGWATSCMGFVAIVLGCVPFILMKYGQQIRDSSKFCMYLKSLETKELLEEEARVASMAASKAASRAVSRAPSLRTHDEESGLGATTIPFSEAPTVSGSGLEDTGSEVHTHEEIVESIAKEIK
ncbi:major facilitator superfamily domain-containing protein [Terfezia claveryi]|nr:major facilitator superfamily domain-containing protein [Terfezia claveryi]